MFLLFVYAQLRSDLFQAGLSPVFDHRNKRKRSLYGTCWGTRVKKKGLKGVDVVAS
jgi:hypothetical protein